MKQANVEVIANMIDIVDTQYNTALSKLFSKPIMVELAEKGSSDYLNYIILKSGFIHCIEGNITYAELFEMILEYLCRHHRSEYIYKYTVFTKILEKLPQPTSYFNEFNIANSKADVVLINGTSYVYEIKTKYDSLDRLSSQIDSYRLAFDYIYVLTHPVHLQALEKVLKCSNDVGLLLLTDDNEIQIFREAKSNRQNVNPAYIFDCLRRREYVDLIKKYFGDIGNIPNTQIYTICKNLFSKLPPITAHTELVNTLRNRNADPSISNLILGCPSSLKPLQIEIALSKNQIHSIARLLQSSFSTSSLYSS